MTPAADTHTLVSIAPHASIIIRVHSGGLRVTRGKLRPHARNDVADILSEAGIVRGFIAITPDQRVSFSRHIPSPIHQRLRNVLVNQWA